MNGIFGNERWWKCIRNISINNNKKLVRGYIRLRVCTVVHCLSAFQLFLHPNFFLEITKKKLMFFFKSLLIECM